MLSIPAVDIHILGTLNALYALYVSCIPDSLKHLVRAQNKMYNYF